LIYCVRQPENPTKASVLGVLITSKIGLQHWYSPSLFVNIILFFSRHYGAAGPADAGAGSRDDGYFPRLLASTAGQLKPAGFLGDSELLE
jgi:hypothetical protein